MKQLFTLAFALLVLGVTSAFAQSTVTGLVKDSGTGNPVAGVSVGVAGASSVATATNVNGEYSLTISSPGKYQLEFIFPGYTSQTVNIDVVGTMTCPDVMLAKVPVAQADVVENLNVNTYDEVTISSDDLDSESSTQAVSGLLQSSKDVFVSAAAYSFSPARFQVRGYDSEYTDVYMSGISTNDLESGYGSWSAWGGLNDATRSQLVTNGLAPSNFSFGGLGGATYINTRPSQARVQTKVSYAATNRTYNNRIMATYSSGLMDNGLAISLSASRRWAEEAYVPGTNYDAWGLFLAIEKKLNDNHSISLTAYNAPTKRGMQGVSTDEAKELADDNYYNPN